MNNNTYEQFFLSIDSLNGQRKILKKKFMALQSLKYGISARTIEDYLRTLIDAEKIIQDKKMIWRAE